jgi:regulator of CtrA degradation
MLAESENQLTLRVINSLYVEAMVLADEARAYFDQASHDMRDRMPPLIRVTFSCESLKVTTRLMHVVAWLLSQRALAGKKGYFRETARLGNAVESDTQVINGLPEEAQRIILASAELYGRVRRLDGNMQRPVISHGPARQLHSRLAAFF